MDDNNLAGLNTQPQVAATNTQSAQSSDTDTTMPGSSNIPTTGNPPASAEPIVPQMPATDPSAMPNPAPSPADTVNADQPAPQPAEQNMASAPVETPVSASSTDPSVDSAQTPTEQIITATDQVAQTSDQLQSAESEIITDSAAPQQTISEALPPIKNKSSLPLLLIILGILVVIAAWMAISSGYINL